MGFSPLATAIARPRAANRRPGALYGLVCHTSGSGIVEQAKAQGADPLEYAVSYYAERAAYYAHYVVGYDGHIVQIADENERAPHVGFLERPHFEDGSWERMLPPEMVQRWHDRWPGKGNPTDLFEGPSPNSVYVGCELIPLARALEDGSRYTPAQHQAVAELILDFGQRSKLEPAWWHTSRLCGHEDLNPLTRSLKGEGWDPGIMRRVPWFRWEWVLGLLDSAWQPLQQP